MHLALLLSVVLAVGLRSAEGAIPTSPPRGWNSYDSYTWVINETQVLENARAVQQYLLPHGYEYVVIDYLWYQSIKNTSHLFVDDHGRLQPDPERFPHSADGSGFKWLAQQIHAMGLKFGIHIMRGISKQAVVANLPIAGAPQYTTAEIEAHNTECSWYKGVSSINFSHPGAMAFEASMVDQYREWGVDFLKYDCVYGGNFDRTQIEGVSKAIGSSSIVLSLSPGDGKPPSEHAQATHTLANMYRITGDDWDSAKDLDGHFLVAAQHASANLIGAEGHNGPSWPDLDMLPLGLISHAGSSSGPDHHTKLTKGEQRMQMLLWCVARSPLMFGGVVSDLASDSWTLSLLTNPHLLALNANSTRNQQLSYTEGAGGVATSIWSATGTAGAYYAAFFNLKTEEATRMEASIADLSNGACHSAKGAKNIWTGEAISVPDTMLSVTVPPRDAVGVVFQC